MYRPLLWRCSTVTNFVTNIGRSLARNCAAPLDPKNGATAKDWRQGKPVRVVRSYKGAKHSKYSPKEGLRYDGIYKVSECPPFENKF